MKYNELFEIRSGLLNHFYDKFPNTPQYVVRDFIYKTYKDNPKGIEQDIEEWLNSLTWTLQNLFITIDIFDDWTQNRLKELIAQETENPRFSTQKSLIIQRGISQEPIILTLVDGKYELQEGWHRTVESFKMYPNGYQQKAWIGKEED